MSSYDNEVAALLAKHPKTKDKQHNRGKTCRSLIYDAIDAVAYGVAIRTGTVDPEVEEGLHLVCLAVDRAIDADPMLKEIFKQPRPKQKQLVAMGLNLDF